MTRLSGEGISVELPAGWDGAIGPSAQLDDGSVRRVVAHFASFPLPALRGDFGGGAVELMGTEDALVVLFDYGAAAAGTPLFAASGIPSIDETQFDRTVLQRSVVGQSGVQRFFTVGGRAFCLYVVVGSHLDRVDVVPDIQQLLSSVTIS